jgi:predicted nucleic acid-binding protein
MRGKPLLPGGRQLSSEFLVDSMILMHYDNGYDKCISWWEESVSIGCKVYVSTISLMERYKGIAGLPGRKNDVLQQFEERIKEMRREKKIYGILLVNKRIATKAYELLRDYCLRYTPPQERCRVEALICDMLIAATALVNGLPLYTFNQRDFGWITGLQVVEPSYEPEKQS